MPRYAAFLRGINVTGTRIKAADLCKPFEALGFENVTTFRASGNVIFDGSRRAGPKLAADIEARLAADLGFGRAVTFLRGAKELHELAETDPFGGAEGKLQVAFLLHAPSADARKQVEALQTAQDRLAFAHRELLWLPEAGVGGSTLDLNAVQKLIGPSTTRTMGTVQQIAAKYFA